MTKEELYRQIQAVESQIADAEDEELSLIEKWDSLVEFESKCNTKASAFVDSIQRRKTALTSINDLLSRVKSALAYKQHMHDLLNGNEYTKAKNSIDTIMGNISTQKSKVSQALEDIASKITGLKNTLSSLQYEYNTYPEGVETDG